MGSRSDLPVMEVTQKTLADFSVDADTVVASAHRNPREVFRIAQRADRRYEVIIAGAGGAAHLPGVIAANTTLPVIGVPINTKAMAGLDSLLSIVQMPSGVPVATVAIDGAKNAAILAVQILSLKYPSLKIKLQNMKRQLTRKGKSGAA